MSKLLSILCHPLLEIRARYYANYVFNTEKYNRIIDTDRKKAIDMLWIYKFRKKFPWKNPVTLNEKITWLSGASDTSEWTRLADKFLVRKYVEERIGKSVLTELYGVWNNVDEIDFNSLPMSFAIKCTHDCGSTVIVKDKSKVDVSEIKSFLRDHLKKKFGYATCEPHYTKITPRVIAEELLPEDCSDFSSSLVDYKIWCINGKALFVFVCYDRHLESEEKNVNDHYAIFDLYDLPLWNPIRENLSDWYREVKFKDIPRPDNLDEMINYAENLAADFPQVRVDLYNVRGRIYFGELTFTSDGGLDDSYTQEFQEKIGKMIKLPVF